MGVFSKTRLVFSFVGEELEESATKRIRALRKTNPAPASTHGKSALQGTQLHVSRGSGSERTIINLQFIQRCTPNLRLNKRKKVFVDVSFNMTFFWTNISTHLQLPEQTFRRAHTRTYLHHDVCSASLSPSFFSFSSLTRLSSSHLYLSSSLPSFSLSLSLSHSRLLPFASTYMCVCRGLSGWEVPCQNRKDRCGACIRSKQQLIAFQDTVNLMIFPS